MVKVVLADDEEYIRLFLKNVMSALSYKVVAEVETGDEVFPVMKKQRPDILFLDINMPNLTGIEFLKLYAKEFPKTCIIILTSARSFDLVEEASQTGASCFLRKDMQVEQMMKAIKKTWTEFKEKNNIKAGLFGM